jgi:hypothetical protein
VASGAIGEEADAELAGDEGAPVKAEVPAEAANVPSPQAGETGQTGPTWTDAPLDLPGDAETAQERVAALERELHVSLAKYDVTLESEQRRAEGAGAFPAGGAGEGPSAETGSNDPSSGGGGPNGTSAGGRAGSDSENGASPPDDSAGGRMPSVRGPMPSQNTRVVPEDIPNGQDDDVVARQIREAAMNEPDDALREKLWQEYRDYKASISGRVPADTPAPAQQPTGQVEQEGQ